MHTVHQTSRVETILAKQNTRKRPDVASHASSPVPPHMSRCGGSYPRPKNQLSLTRSRPDRSPVCEHYHATRVKNASNCSIHNNRNPWDFLSFQALSGYRTTSKHHTNVCTSRTCCCPAESPSRSCSTWRRMTVKLHTHIHHPPTHTHLQASPEGCRRF